MHNMAVMSGTNRLLDLVLFYVDSGIHVIIRPLRIRSLFELTWPQNSRVGRSGDNLTKNFNYNY